MKRPRYGGSGKSPGLDAGQRNGRGHDVGVEQVRADIGRAVVILVGIGDEHRAQPLVVSITQSTELGTLYTAEEIRALADHAHERGMRLHLDGARLANAAAALDLPTLREFEAIALGLGMGVGPP